MSVELYLGFVAGLGVGLGLGYLAAAHLLRKAWALLPHNRPVAIVPFEGDTSQYGQGKMRRLDDLKSLQGIHGVCEKIKAEWLKKEGK